MADGKLAYARQHVEEDDVAAVAATLRSDWLTTGPALTAFEEQVAAYCGARCGAALSSATAALHATCHALGIGAGDRVWTSPISFVASANCALYCDATVDFVDIDPRSYNICPIELKNKLSAAAQRNALPKALIAVHFGGLPCDLRELAALTRPYGIAIIEDATHAFGATYRGERVGSCRYSDAAVFSFHAIKSITTGEGGMVVTNRENIAQSVRRFRSHGITPNTSASEPWRYEQRELGFNYRMTDLQAALGTSQLAKLDTFVARRTELAKRYDQGLAELPLQLPGRDAGSTSAWHLYPIQIVAGDRAGTRRKLFLELLRNGIGSQVHYIPIHTQPFYRGLGFRAGQFPVAEHYYDGALSLPLFVDLTESDQDRVIEVVRATLTEL
jgi:UDP-4-amino-4,6-dideoxy-N-acetyl-beta-L-altrosamine transaminase